MWLITNDHTIYEVTAVWLQQSLNKEAGRQTLKKRSAPSREERLFQAFSLENTRL